ncbi:MAG: HAMP domain-containing sensor histidine kinase [Archaeoglobaceae archaeon]
MDSKIVASVLFALAVAFSLLGEFTNSEIVASFFVLFATFLSSILSLQLYKGSEGERKRIMGAISLSSALFFVAVLVYLDIDLGPNAGMLPITIASFPIFLYGVSKISRELKFLKIKHLIIPGVIFVIAILSSLVFPMSVAHIFFAIDALTLAVFLSLFFLYFNTETRIYWAPISLAFAFLYFFAFFQKVEFASSAYFSELFLSLFASTLLFMLYEVRKRDIEITSFEAMESEKRELEELVASVDELKEGFRLMNQALRHDVLKKLQIISGYVEAYELTRNSEFIEKSLKAVKECAEFIEKIGMLEKVLSIEKSKLKPIKVEDIAKEVAKNYEIPVSIKGNAVAIADESLSFVLDVILDNAQRHSGTERVDVFLSEIEDECEIRVVDYGVGIPEEVKRVLFKERFRSGETAGLGLGLYIVKKLVDRYGGKVWVEDTKPRGATFVIRLKATQTLTPQ